MAMDDIIIDGKQFYLMEHQEYHQMAGIILDSYGKMVVEECEHGFDEAAKQKIHEFIQALEPMTQEKNQQKIRMEHYQKLFENGTYERSWESGTEANYDMVDGRVNNQKRRSLRKSCLKSQRNANP